MFNRYFLDKSKTCYFARIDFLENSSKYPKSFPDTSHQSRTMDLATHRIIFDLSQVRLMQYSKIVYVQQIVIAKNNESRK